MSRLTFSAVKKPAGSKRLQGINIQFMDTTLHFRPQALGASDITSPEKFMSSVNDLLLNFSDEDHRALFNVYSTVMEVRETPKCTHDDIFALDDAMNTFFSIITRERIEAWGRDNKGYAIAPSIGSITPMRDGSVSHSCTRTEYLDICILSTLFKMLIPFQDVAPHIEGYLPNLVSDYWSLFRLLNSAGLIEEYPAFQELIAKTAAKAESLLGKGVPTGLTAKGVGEEDFYRIILIPKLFRDLTRLETEVETFDNGVNNNISYKINLSIKNYIQNEIAPMFSFNITQGPVSTDEDGGNTTRQEAKAGGERFSSIYGIFFTGDYEDFIGVVNASEEFPDLFKIDESEVMLLAKAYPSRIKIGDAQDIIAGTIFNEVIPIDATIYRPPSVEPIMMAYAACVAKKLDLPNIHNLMMCSIDTEGQLTESETRNSVLRSPIVHPHHQDVLDTYPAAPGGHPFTETVELIVKSIIRSNYVVAIEHDGFELGAEWFPRIINDRGIKDELVELVAHINGVYDEQ